MKQTRAEKQAEAAQKAAQPKKRGEVNELMALLNNPDVQKDVIKLREVMRKVINYSTMGVDMSKLFTPVIMVSITKDTVVKKMTNQFLVTYAKQNQDLAILAINTFEKDCRDENPTVRGMALRSLCSLRLKTVVEYVVPCLERGLVDQSAYVRRNAIMGVLKLYHIEKERVRDSNLVTALQNLVLDADALVVTNALLALKEITGDLPKTKPLIHHLLNRLKDFNEWCMCVVLDLVAQYQPENETELFGIMNLLEPFLRYHNTAVILATTKVYMSFTENMPQVFQQVMTRLKQPLLTLMASNIPEVAYCVLAHMKLLMRRCKDTFQDEYRQFYCRYNEPTFIHHLKIQILPMLATPDNYVEILSELKEYVPGTPESTSREAIRAICQLGILLEEAHLRCFETLVEFFDIDVDYIRAETIIVMQDMLRKHPENAEEVMEHVPRILRKTEDPNGRAACLWLIGTFPDFCADAPYIVEPLIDDIEEQKDICVRLELLTTAVKLFFRRAPEMQAMLGRLFKALSEDDSSPDVTDRVHMYYRLLANDMDSAKQVIDTTENGVEGFVDMDEKLVNTLFSEFNTLSVLYEKPATHFITTKELVVPDLGYNDAEEDEEEAGEFQAEQEMPSMDMGTQEAAAPAADGFDDFMNFDMGTSGAGDMMGLGNVFSMDPNPTTDRGTFQQKWTTLPEAHQETFQIMSTPTDPKLIESTLSTYNIAFVANGYMGQVMKIFLIAYHSGSAFETELLIAQNNCKITVKTDDPSHVSDFVDILKSALNTL